MIPWPRLRLSMSFFHPLPCSQNVGGFPQAFQKATPFLLLGRLICRFQNSLPISLRIQAVPNQAAPRQTQGSVFTKLPPSSPHQGGSWVISTILELLAALSPRKPGTAISALVAFSFWEPKNNTHRRRSHAPCRDSAVSLKLSCPQALWGMMGQSLAESALTFWVSAKLCFCKQVGISYSKWSRPSRSWLMGQWSMISAGRVRPQTTRL